MKINIFETGFRKRHPYKRLREHFFRPYWFPVQNAWRELRACEADVTFHDALKPAIFDCDVLILSSRSVDQIVAQRGFGAESRAQVCEDASSKGCRVVWFDSRDSAGTCQFDVLPHVHRYLKRQLYRNRSLYRESLFYGRAYADFYHREFGIGADGDKVETPTGEIAPGSPYVTEAVAPADADLAKLAVAWGCGAEFHWPFLKLSSPLRYIAKAAASQFSGFAYPEPEHVSPSLRREHDFCALFDAKRYSVKSVGYQRHLALTQAEAHPSDTKVTGRVPRAKFYETLSSSKITISTFGWGEVCFREYEASYCGSAVLMADMSGIETYPNLYIPEFSYLPFKWDMSDLTEKIDELIADDELRIHMATNAQDMLLKQWTSDGRETFASRFLSMLS